MRRQCCGKHPEIRDFGGEPFLFNIDHATNRNENFRTTLWTGTDLQLTLMSIPPRGEIGMEMHDDVDQFIRVENGRARVYMGSCPNAMEDKGEIDSRYAILIPAGTWHNIVNVGGRPLKLYSLYAPPKHPRNTVHPRKEDAEH